jgi:hypothetical protein
VAFEHAVVDHRTNSPVRKEPESAANSTTGGISLLFALFCIGVLPLVGVFTIRVLARLHDMWTSTRLKTQRRLLSASGRIVRFTAGVLGNVDGFALDSGLLVKVPPALGPTLDSLVPPDSRVSVWGYLRESRGAVMDSELLIVSVEKRGQPAAVRINVVHNVPSRRLILQLHRV